MALQRLVRRRALGVREQRVQLALERLEAKLARRLMALQQLFDTISNGTRSSFRPVLTSRADAGSR